MVQRRAYVVNGNEMGIITTELYIDVQDFGERRGLLCDIRFYFLVQLFYVLHQNTGLTRSPMQKSWL